MKAFISDIHANLEALQAVLEDIAKYDVEAIYCLGDTVGYGPNPRECVDLVMRCQVCLLGNHDQASVFDPSNFNEAAQRAIFWTRSQLEASVPSRQAMQARWDFLGELPRTHREPGCLFVHGSPRNPVNEYIFPEDIYNPRKIDGIFGLVERYCFQGHTHLPGVFTEAREFFSPEELGYVHPMDERKTLCNVGSVGQPRDGDWRSCYVLFDGETIQYRRVEYDVDATIAKIKEVADLDDFLAERLRQGR